MVKGRRSKEMYYLRRIINIDGFIIEGKSVGIFFEVSNYLICVVMSVIKCSKRREFERILRTFDEEV